MGGVTYKAVMVFFQKPIKNLGFVEEAVSPGSCTRGTTVDT
jgi:hypothetical protein